MIIPTTLILRGTDFGPVCNASGARNFIGEGYWFHPLWRPVGLDWENSMFVAKTTTLLPREGNMPLKQDTQPQLLPDCIRVYPRKRLVLNAVGLSGPGAKWLFKNAGWRYREDNFVISFMSVAETKKLRQEELEAFVRLMQSYSPINWRSRVALEINFSCPNANLDPNDLVDEIGETLKIATTLKIPLLVKLNAEVPVDVAIEACSHEECDGLTISNTIPWGHLPDRIDWAKLFGTTESPLAKYGGGGLSGAPLLPIVCDWVRQARQAGFTKPIIGGGGVLSEANAQKLWGSGVNAVSLGSIALLRPWRLRRVIKWCNTHAPHYRRNM